MGSLQSFGLCAQFLTGRNDDDHLVVAVGVQVLIRNVIDILRFAECGCSEIGQRCRCVVSDVDVVEAHLTVALVGQRNGILFLKVVNDERSRAVVGFVVVVVRSATIIHAHGQRVELNTVQRNHDVRRDVGRCCHGQDATGGVR